MEQKMYGSYNRGNNTGPKKCSSFVGVNFLWDVNTARVNTASNASGLKMEETAPRYGKVTAIILNKQSQRADKGLFSRLRVGRETKNSSPHRNVLQNVTQSLRLGRILKNTAMNLRVP
jgi:hypothetical protein